VNPCLFTGSNEGRHARLSTLAARVKRIEKPPIHTASRIEPRRSTAGPPSSTVGPSVFPNAKGSLTIVSPCRTVRVPLHNEDPSRISTTPDPIISTSLCGVAKPPVTRKVAAGPTSNCSGKSPLIAIGVRIVAVKQGGRLSIFSEGGSGPGLSNCNGPDPDISSSPRPVDSKCPNVTRSNKSTNDEQRFAVVLPTDCALVTQTTNLYHVRRQLATILVTCILGRSLRITGSRRRWTQK